MSIAAEQSRSGTGVKKTLGRPVVINVVLTVVGLISAGLVPFGFNLAVGRGYGPAVLGPVSVALALALFLGQIPGTISGAATKFIAQSLGDNDERRAQQVFQFLLVITTSFSLLIGIATIALAPVLESAYKISFAVVLLAGALIPTYTLYLFFKSCYYGWGRVQTYLINEILSDAAFFGVLMAVFVFGATGWLLLPFVLNNAIFSAIAIRDMTPYLREFHWMGKQDRREVVNYALINGSGSTASLGRWSLGTVIAGVFLSHHSVGLLAAAVAITAPLALLPRAISLVTFALMARLHGAGEHASVRAVLQQSTEWLVLVLGIPSGLAIINASFILTHVFKSEYAAAAVATQLIIAGAYITDISRPSIDALSSTRYVRIATVASFLGLFVSLVVWLAFIPRDGITATAMGFALGALVTATLPAYFACRRLGSQPIVFVRPAIMLLILSVLSVFANRYDLIASVVFVIATCMLYAHVMRDTFSIIRTTVTSSSGLAEQSV